MGSTASVSKKISPAPESEQIETPQSDSCGATSVTLESSWQSSLQSLPLPSVCGESAESFYNPLVVYNYGTPVEQQPEKGWWQHGVHWRENPESLRVVRPPSRWLRPRHCMADYVNEINYRENQRIVIPQDDLSTEFAYPLPIPKDKPSILAEDKSWRAYRLLADNGYHVQRVPTMNVLKNRRTTSNRITHRQVEKKQQEGIRQAVDGNAPPRSLMMSSQGQPKQPCVLSKAESVPALKQPLFTASPQQGGAYNTDWSNFTEAGKTVPLSALPDLVAKTEDTRFGNNSAIARQDKSGRKYTQAMFSEYSHKMYDLGIDGYSVPTKWITREVAHQTPQDDYEEEWVESRISRLRREAATAETRPPQYKRPVRYVPKRPKSEWLKEFDEGAYRPVKTIYRGGPAAQGYPILE